MDHRVPPLASQSEINGGGSIAALVDRLETAFTRDPLQTSEAPKARARRRRSISDDPQPRSLRAALWQFRAAALGIGAMSGLVNLLYLTGSLFMMQVYDRVLPSRSVPTLVALGALTLTLYVFQALMDLLRTRLLSRVAAAIEIDLTCDVFRLLAQPVAGKDGGEPQQPLRDLDQLRTFLSGTGPTAILDLPWIPIYLALCFLFHPLIGWSVAVGALLLGTVALATELQSRAPARDASRIAAERGVLAESGRRNAGAIAAMGMTDALAARWGDVAGRYLAEQQRASDIVHGYLALSKFLRIGLQSAVLGLGAYVVINDQATGGVMIASSILTARALAPVEAAIANWRGFIGARQGARRLFARLGDLRTRAPFALPAPTESFAVEGLSVTVPGQSRLLVRDVTFRLQAGDGLGIIGPSASGKSSLLRALLGIWEPARGVVRFDDAARDQWAPAQIGPHIGYLPQEVELFAGSVADNIARFDPEADEETIIAAARAAGVHDLIVRLPAGYETQIGQDGTALSAGQRQRIGLARALYGNPFLVVLDEPNSNLDMPGEDALTRALLGVRQRGGIAIVVAHRTSALVALDKVAVMGEGCLQAFGPKEQVLRNTVMNAPVPARAAKFG